MDKILTISVAAYNMEQYIEELLTSVLSSSCKEDVELIISDDGGSDGTMRIVQEYAERYPDIVIPLPKENGGYGSVLNATVPMAQGRFFRTCDGDDLLNTEGLERLIAFLKETDADWILTKAEKFFEDGSRCLTPEEWPDYKGSFEIDEIKDAPVGLWHVNSSFRTALLQKAFRPLPEHSLYTDLLYMVWPMPYVKKVAFLPEVVYLYRAGRPGQSVSSASKRKHCEEQISVVKAVMAYYREAGGDRCAPMARNRFYVSYKWLIVTLLLLPPSSSVLRRILREESIARKYFRGFYDMGAFESAQIRLLRRSGYLAYWPLALRGSRAG